MGCNSSKHKCERKTIKNNEWVWCDNYDECKKYRCDNELVQSSNKWCISYWRSQTSVAKNARERAEQAVEAKQEAETRAEQAVEAKKAAELRAAEVKKVAEAKVRAAEIEAEINRKIVLKKEEMEEALLEAEERAKAEAEKLVEMRNKSKELRKSNACNQNNIDIRREQLLLKERIKIQEIETQEAKEKAERDKVNKENEAKKLASQTEAMAKRMTFSETAKMRVSFTPIPKQETPVLPVQIETFTNPEKLIDSADQVINNIYTNHHEHNLKTYVQNKIVIDEMTDKINNINSRLQYKMNKNINYGPDGQLNFY